MPAPGHLALRFSSFQANPGRPRPDTSDIRLPTGLSTLQMLGTFVLKIGNNTYNYGLDVTQSREKFNDFLNKISRTYKHEIRCEVTKSIIQIISIKCLNNDYTDMDKYLKLLTDFDESHVV